MSFIYLNIWRQMQQILHQDRLSLVFSMTFNSSRALIEY